MRREGGVVAVVTMSSRPTYRDCDALTLKGARCRREGTYEVELEGHLALLCVQHHQWAQHRPIALWDRPVDPSGLPPPPVPRRRWTAEDDEVLLLSTRAGETASVVAQMLGRTKWAVRQRRRRLKREGRA